MFLFSSLAGFAIKRILLFIFTEFCLFRHLLLLFPQETFILIYFRNQPRRCWEAARSPAVLLAFGPYREAGLLRCSPACLRRHLQTRAWATWTQFPAPLSSCPAPRKLHLDLWANPLSVHARAHLLHNYIYGIFKCSINIINVLFLHFTGASFTGMNEYERHHSNNTGERKVSKITESKRKEERKDLSFEMLLSWRKHDWTTPRWLNLKSDLSRQLWAVHTCHTICEWLSLCRILIVAATAATPVRGGVKATQMTTWTG